MSATLPEQCSASWPKPPIFSTKTGKALKQEPWRCNRPAGHGGGHQVIDAKTFQILATPDGGT